MAYTKYRRTRRRTMRSSRGKRYKTRSRSNRRPKRVVMTKPALKKVIRREIQRSEGGHSHYDSAGVPQQTGLIWKNIGDAIEVGTNRDNRQGNKILLKYIEFKYSFLAVNEERVEVINSANGERNHYSQYPLGVRILVLQCKDKSPINERFFVRHNVGGSSGFRNWDDFASSESDVMKYYLKVNPDRFRVLHERKVTMQGQSGPPVNGTVCYGKFNFAINRSLTYASDSTLGEKELDPSIIICWFPCHLTANALPGQGFLPTPVMRSQVDVTTHFDP